MNYDHIDLFSGIGGFALAARWAGIKTVWFVEIDKFCQKVLQKNFPGIKIHDDIKTFKYATHNSEINVLSDSYTRCERKRGPHESKLSPDYTSGCNCSKECREQDVYRPFLLTGGFPCQPFSCAGKRKGTDDPRHLWPEMLRVIKEFKPKWIIGENVPGIINIKGMEQPDSDPDMESETIDDGSDREPSGVLISILSDLEQAGYSILPTPKQQNANHPGEHGQGGKDLQTEIHGQNRGLKLQPAFVEWMQGYPIGWTDLNPSETQ